VTTDPAADNPDVPATEEDPSVAPSVEVTVVVPTP